MDKRQLVTGLARQVAVVQESRGGLPRTRPGPHPARPSWRSSTRNCRCSAGSRSPESPILGRRGTDQVVREADHLPPRSASGCITVPIGRDELLALGCLGTRGGASARPCRLGSGSTRRRPAAGALATSSCTTGDTCSRRSSCFSSLRLVRFLGLVREEPSLRYPLFPSPPRRLPFPTSGGASPASSRLGCRQAFGRPRPPEAPVAGPPLRPQ